MSKNNELSSEVGTSISPTKHMKCMAALKNIKCTDIVDVCQRTVILVHEKFYDGIVTLECCSQHRCHASLYI